MFFPIPIKLDRVSTSGPYFTQLERDGKGLKTK